MKQLLLLMFSVSTVFFLSSFCNKTADVTTGNNTNQNKDNNNSTSTNMQMNIKIGSKTFTATLYDNPTVTAFKKRLPLTVGMTDLNLNEKYYHFSDPLPANALNPGTIQNGDLMLYQDYSLVLFYKTFSTSYNYTRLGRIDDPSGLEEALGSGNVTVTFELK